MTESPRRKKTGLLWTLLFTLSLLCFTVSSCMLVVTLLSRKKGADSYKELLNAAAMPTVTTPAQITSVQKTEPAVTEAPTVQEPEPLETVETEAAPEETEEPTEEFRPVINFEYLKSINKETCGWIRIPDTEIDYPIITSQTYYYGYYETHLFDGTKNSMGCIFLDKDNKAVGTSDNTVIFGHNVRVSGIFHDLDYFLKPAFAEQHLDFEIYTPEKNYNCHIICAGGGTEESDVYMTSISNTADRNDWIAALKQINRMSNDIAWKAGMKYVTLVTCGSAAGRIVVVAELTEM